MRRRKLGFTLIELMITVAVLGILVAIAYPSYTRYVEQARRADAKAALLDAAQRLERCYTQNNTYVGCPVRIGLTAEGHYTIAAPTQTLTAYTLTAAPIRPSPCGTYTLRSDGSRTVNGTADRCW